MVKLRTEKPKEPFSHVDERTVPPPRWEGGGVMDGNTPGNTDLPPTDWEARTERVGQNGNDDGRR